MKKKTIKFPLLINSLLLDGFLENELPDEQNILQYF
jgi:hypothetical protein